jgi:hypothetical protein
MKKLVKQKILLQRTELRAFFSLQNASERNSEIHDPARKELRRTLTY